MKQNNLLSIKLAFQWILNPLIVFLISSINFQHLALDTDISKSNSVVICVSVLKKLFKYFKSSDEGWKNIEDVKLETLSEADPYQTQNQLTVAFEYSSIFNSWAFESYKNCVDERENGVN